MDAIMRKRNVVAGALVTVAYNLIRTVMAQAAIRHGIAPRSIRFKGTLQILEAFQPLIAYAAPLGPGRRETLYQDVLRTIGLHRVADRPDRFEPRMKKRRPKNYDRMTKPQRELKLEMLKRFSKI